MECTNGKIKKLIKDNGIIIELMVKVRQYGMIIDIILESIKVN
jgi:hypothetical protein